MLDEKRRPAWCEAECHAVEIFPPAIVPAETRCPMADSIFVQYLGFQASTLVRKYIFAVREKATEPLHYTLTIANDAFVSHRARYQDAPAICSLRLHRELDAHANHPPTTSFCITDSELAIYLDTRKPKANRSFYKRRDDD
jgi:hypothetical protein